MPPADRAIHGAAAGTARIDAEATLAEARDAYFAANGFGADGGYHDRFVKLELGPLPLYLPNTASRVRAVRYHDLHHVLTGYATDLRGEIEISAWEIASGCASMAAAWFLNLLALWFGALVWPKHTLRAFTRGRSCGNLYREPYGEELLRARVSEVRRRLRLDRPVPAPTRAQLALFGVWTAVSLAHSLLVLAVPLAAIGWVVSGLH